MPITTGSHPKDLWPGIMAHFGATYAEKPMRWSQVFKTVNSSKAYEEFQEDTGFGLPAQKTEAGGVSYDTDKQGYTARWTNVTYGLGAIISMEAIQDNQYFDVGMKKAAKLARSMRHGQENIHANVLNRAFTAAYSGGDGKELCATDHPTVNGTQANEPTVGSDLSETAIEDALTSIRGFKDSRGLRIQAMGEKLVIPAAYEFDAVRILSSTNQSGTANNDINAMRSMGVLPGGTVVWDYLTDSDAWFILTDVPEGMLSLQRMAPQLTQDNDFDTANARMKSIMRLVAGWGDWRGIWGNPGI